MQADSGAEVILIIEDEPTIADLFKTLLEMEGFRPRVVPNSQAGVEFLEANTPDAIVLDVMLPGESGLEVARFARQNPRLADVPIIIVSARTQKNDLEAGEKAGADVYLKKPISNALLVDTVREQIGRRSHTMVRAAPERESLDRVVEKAAIEVERYLAEINRSLDAYENSVEQLERNNGRTLDETQLQARQLAEVYRRQIRSNQAVGWKALESVLTRLELKETAVRRRSSHEPTNPAGWQEATGRAQFVREDCRAWARYNPEQIFREYEVALADGDEVYSFLLERYGPQAFEAEDDWERLTAFQERIRAATNPDPETLALMEDYYERINPLRARLAAVRLPDALLLVERRKNLSEGAEAGVNGRGKDGRGPKVQWEPGRIRPRAESS